MRSGTQLAKHSFDYGFRRCPRHLLLSQGDPSGPAGGNGSKINRKRNYRIFTADQPKAAISAARQAIACFN
jgi:hypothetical protein